MTEQTQIKTVFIVAMEREVKPLLERCEAVSVDDFLSLQEPVSTLRHPLSVYRCENGIVVCSGPGYKNAASAARQAMDRFSPEMMVSIGFAGALAPGIKVGISSCPGTLSPNVPVRRSPRRAAKVRW